MYVQNLQIVEESPNGIIQ